MMKKSNKKFTAITLILACAAAGMLILGGIGAARAALQYRSKIYELPLGMQEIGIGVWENGKNVGSGKLLLDTLGEEEELKPGVEYKEDIDVSNEGVIDEFIRVVVYKYWKDTEDGDKNTELDPSLIVLGIEDGWIHDESLSTPEREVYYYSSAIAKGKKIDFMKSLQCDGSIIDFCTQSDDGHGNVTTEFIYEGKYLGLKVEASGVQTHHAKDAILSAWGAKVSISGNKLSLK